MEVGIYHWLTWSSLSVVPGLRLDTNMLYTGVLGGEREGREGRERGRERGNGDNHRFYQCGLSHSNYRFPAKFSLNRFCSKKKTKNNSITKFITWVKFSRLFHMHVLWHYSKFTTNIHSSTLINNCTNSLLESITLAHLQWVLWVDMTVWGTCGAQVPTPLG